MPAVCSCMAYRTMERRIALGRPKHWWQAPSSRLVPSPRNPCASRRLGTTRARAADDRTAVVTTQFVLSCLRASIGEPHEGSGGQEEMAVTGSGRHLGIAVSWNLRWRPDGAFFEEIKGRELGFKWGFDGGASSSCWEMDSSGVSRAIECDDHEALLVGAWVRTGCWLSPQLHDRFELALLDPPAIGAASMGKRARSKTARRMAAVAGGQQAVGSVRPAGGPATNCPPGSRAAALEQQQQQQQQQRQLKQGGNDVIGERASSSASASTSRHADGDISTDGMVSALLDSLNTNAPSIQLPKELVLTLRLKGGKLLSYVHVCTSTWTVTGLDQPLCGDTEMWKLSDWSTRWGVPGLCFPTKFTHHAIGGGRHVYHAESCGPAKRLSPLWQFQLPATPLLPTDTVYDAHFAPDVPVWRADSGHVLIRPTINGVEGGFMVVDTGASGFVISPKASMELGLDAFGELFAASIAGKVPAQFIKVRTWSLGPLTIRSPVMMTMDLDGLVRGSPGPVIGIVGYDIFRRAVVTMPRMLGDPPPLPPSSSGDAHMMLASSLRGTPGVMAASVASADASGGVGSAEPGVRSDAGCDGSPGTPFRMMVHNPETFMSTGGCNAEWMWYPVKMIASLPHLEVEFQDASGEQRSVLLMLDTGACGADIMLHSRCIREMQLDMSFHADDGDAAATSHYVRGVGGQGGDSVRVEMVELPWLDMGGVHFDRVKVMCAGIGGLDISLYSGGIICGDLVARLSLAIDYSRKRVGFPRSHSAC